MIRIRKWFWQWSPTTKSDANPLHSVAKMQVILERERQRTERGNSTFALLTMTLPGRVNQQHFDALRTMQDCLARIAWELYCPKLLPSAPTH
jgi:hypothetical protein